MGPWCNEEGSPNIDTNYRLVLVFRFVPQQWLDIPSHIANTQVRTWYWVVSGQLLNTAFQKINAGSGFFLKRS